MLSLTLSRRDLFNHYPHVNGIALKRKTSLMLCQKRVIIILSKGVVFPSIHECKRMSFLPIVMSAPTFSRETKISFRQSIQKDRMNVQKELTWNSWAVTRNKLCHHMNHKSFSPLSISVYTFRFLHFFQWSHLVAQLPSHSLSVKIVPFQS